MWNSRKLSALVAVTLLAGARIGDDIVKPTQDALARRLLVDHRVALHSGE